MLEITENAAKLIRKMTVKNGFPDGGLRIGIKAGGCSGLSYTFAWEATPREGDLVFIPPGAEHCIKNDGSEDLVYISAASPPVSMAELYADQLAPEMAAYEED